MNTKEIALSFVEMVTAGKVRQAYEKYVSDDFIHHNQYFRGDRETLLAAMEEDALANPGKEFEVKRAVADGDIAVTHSFVRQIPGTPGYVVVHFFKVKDERIVEIWDVLQEINADSPNENGVF